MAINVLLTHHVQHTDDKLDVDDSNGNHRLDLGSDYSNEGIHNSPYCDLNNGLILN